MIKEKQILMGIDTLYHTIHAFGLAEILKSGNIAEIDEEHYWDFLDNTYIDDVRDFLSVFFFFFRIILNSGAG